VDDSERPLFDKSDWPWVMAREGRHRQDLYFFGYGHAYKKALFDFTRVAGKIPMPPRFTFGFWWSRYWPYTDEEMRQLVEEFEIHHVPLDVLVIDMDWHVTFLRDWWKKEKDLAGERKGWTGFTWNKSLFPDPQAFLEWVKNKGLKTTLNLHPASGIQPHEECYPPWPGRWAWTPKAGSSCPSTS
jgi:alpha-glucosidase (family GH31 glycosyl hydrolase)